MNPYFLREQWFTSEEADDRRADRRLRRFDRFAFVCEILAFVCGILAFVYVCYAARGLVL
jgi:hypothetical protein